MNDNIESNSGSLQNRIDIGYRRIARIIVPVLIGQLSATMMGLIDTVMVGRLGVTALAAVGLGNFITAWLLAFVFGMITGVNTRVAQAIGAFRPKAAGAAWIQGLYLGCMLAAGLAALWPLVPWIIGMIGATPEAAGIATEYMQVRVLGGLGFAILMVSDSFYRGLGRTGVLMWCGLAQMVLNCGLNYLLIFGNFGAPRLGAAGAAWGTVLAQLIVGLFLFSTIYGRRVMRSEFGLRDGWRFDPRVFRRLTGLSFPIAVQYFMEMGGITVFFALIARLGDAEMAATNAVIQTWAVAYMAAVALSVGSTTLVGQCVGARRPEDGRLAVRRILKLGLGLSAVASLAYLWLPERLIALFVRGADLERLLPLARPLFLIVVVCLVFDLIFHILSGALRGAGDTRYAMVVTVGTTWLVFVPATLIATSRFGLFGAWSCLVLDVMILSGLMWRRFRGQAWERPPLDEDAVPTAAGPLDDERLEAAA